MVVVVDFDGTLALGDTADVEAMRPNLDLVKLLNQIYLDGNHIKIVTARGSKSCASFEERRKKYFKIISEWLDNHGVKHHELSFYKEYADIYLDDKCHNIKDTIYYDKLDSIYTNNKVRRINDYVVKRCDESVREAKWYELANNIKINTPALLSYDQDTITTRFVEGNKCSDPSLPLEVLQKFKSCKSSSAGTFDQYILRIENHLKNTPGIILGDELLSLLKTLDPQESFNHGDFSVDNMIESGGKLYLIDPIFHDDLFQSYILDAAKNLFSILYYSLDYYFYSNCRKNYVSQLGVSEKELDILIASESVRVAAHNKPFISLSNNLIAGNQL